MSSDYSYDDYLDSGEIKSPVAIETTDYTDCSNDVNPYNSEYVGNDNTEFNKSLVKDTGLDLNQSSSDVKCEIGKSPNNGDVGVDLNDVGNEQLDSILDNFNESNWSDLALEDQKQSMTELADYVAADTGNENPPEIVFRGDMSDGTYGGYNPSTNTIEINENMLDNSIEAADTIAHEMWHAFQQQEANDPNSPRGQEYQEGFDNYISPEYDFEGYENQMVEAEARDYAQGFKERITGV
jgi:soluble cytochrome b562